jgi:hypothetical protein
METRKHFLSKNFKPGGCRLCGREDLVCWLGPDIYQTERSQLKKLRNWNEQTARLFTFDCAARLVQAKGVEDAAYIYKLFVSRRASKRDVVAAAWSVAWAVARDTEWEAERKWQTRRLFMYLDGELN